MPPTFEERFRKVTDWCAANGFPSGFPNFRDNLGATPKVYGTVLISQGVTWQDVLRSTLGSPNSAREEVVRSRMPSEPTPQFRSQILTIALVDSGAWRSLSRITR